MEEYPSPAEGIGLENRQTGNTVRGFESLFLRHNFGTWLSLVEHLVWDQGVAGSNPVVPTI